MRLIIMAAACGVFIVLLGLLNAGRSPTEGQTTIEVVCLVGGLILCFIAIVLARLRALDRRLDGFEAVPPAEAHPPVGVAKPASAATPRADGPAKPS